MYFFRTESKEHFEIYVNYGIVKNCYFVLLQRKFTHVIMYNVKMNVGLFLYLYEPATLVNRLTGHQELLHVYVFKHGGGGSCANRFFITTAVDSQDTNKTLLGFPTRKYIEVRK